MKDGWGKVARKRKSLSKSADSNSGRHEHVQVDTEDSQDNFKQHSLIPACITSNIIIIVSDHDDMSTPPPPNSHTGTYND